MALVALAPLALCAPVASAGDDVAYLIVAPRRFHEALRPFVKHKEKQLPTQVVALETALETEGVDTPERLKRFLYGVWRERGVKYVLLVGDVDVLPVRYMVLDRITKPAFDYAFYPSDLYYADLARSDGTFDDWNARKDGFHARYFGEVRGEKHKDDPINYDGVDYRPDVALGRWPVSTASGLRRIVEKTIRYERALKARKEKRGRAALVMVRGWLDARPFMDRLAEQLAKRLTVERRYYKDDRLDPGTPPPTTAEVVGLFNDGVDLVLHTGHGNTDQWEHCLPAKALDQLRNQQRLAVVFSAGCATAYFAPLPPYGAYVDVDGKPHRGTNHGEVFREPPPPPAPLQTGALDHTGLGEQLLLKGPHGAVAYIGCNTGSQPCGLTLMEGWVRSFGAGECERLGDCWSRAIAYYHAKERLAQLVPTKSWYPASIFFQGMKFMLFGDPTLMLPR